MESKSSAHESISWKLIDSFFKSDPQILIQHHIQSYNNFFNTKIKQLIKEKNPITFFKQQEQITTLDKIKFFDNYRNDQGIMLGLTKEDLKNKLSDKSKEYIDKIWESAQESKGVNRTKTNTRTDYRFRFDMYIGGKNADRLYYGKPIIYDEDRGEHIMYPNEARLRNMTYAFTLHADIVVDFTIYLKNEEIQGTHIEHNETIEIPKVYFGRFPIMLQSDLCILNKLAPEVRFNMGECRNDYGGYFIIDGKEKVIISQEKFADNTLYIQENENELYSYSAKIRSASEDASKPIRTFAVRMVAEQPSSDNGNIVVSIPNVRKPIPLFIIMRALGVISDKEIMTYCLLDLEKNKHLSEYFRSSIHDAGLIFTQVAALKYISTFVKGKSVKHTLEILMNYLLPHVGELNFKQKALYIGYIVNRILKVANGEEKPTNRDSYKYKRLEVSGMLIYQLFREYYDLQQRDIFLNIDKEYLYKSTSTNYKDMNFINLISDNTSHIFRNRIVEEGFLKAFKGNWGSTEHTKRLGALQDLSRLSYFSFICQLRKSNVPISGQGAKIVGPRLLHTTQWGNFCPIHTPDGGNVGTHKHMALMATVSSGTSGYPLIKMLRRFGIKLLEECNLKYLSGTSKIFVNGAWIGVTDQPIGLLNQLKLYRRNSLINIFTSLSFDYYRNELIIYTDAGRICHPVLYTNGNQISYERENIINDFLSKEIDWKKCISGFLPKKKEFELHDSPVFELTDLYDTNDNLEENMAIIDYVDTNEMDGIKLAKSDQMQQEYVKNNVTHKEIHPSVVLSVMANQVIYAENNQYPRGLFSCGQTKQAVSVYHSNFQNRMDKTALVLNYGQIPLIKSRYLNYLNKEEHPYGVNAIVAIACYSGYNVEDAVIFNKASLDRGAFRTTYLTMYESEEEITKVGNSEVTSQFMDVANRNVVGLKNGYDYSKLDPQSGLIKENEVVNDKTIIIGKASNSLGEAGGYIDESKGPKKGQLGYVDKSFMVESEGGKRLAKVRIRHDRIPAIGDKFCSRAGQKGTIGVILEEKDMPFTSEGLRPDIIVNPHAFPSRMTIGHLVEALLGKVCVMYGAFGDCTPFTNKGTKEKLLGDMLIKAGYSSTGNELLYNGMTGEQLETEIYFGPTYYLRLKHMVKDKINHRGRGPRTQLTRQTVGGRANDGGLRIGEMDRDAIISHGIPSFIKDSMMERGDKYKMAICNKTGTIAVYNESRNLFYSLLSDGPLNFERSVDGTLNLKSITRFGRDFSIVEVPYSFKLLYQELQAMNVQMRIITEANVDQLTSLKDSKNIEKLTGLSGFNEVIQETLKKLSKPEEEDLEEATIITPDQKLRDNDDDIYPEMSPAAKHPVFDEERPLYGSHPLYDTTSIDNAGFEYTDVEAGQFERIYAFSNPEIIKVGNEVYMPDENNNGVKIQIMEVDKEGDKISDWQVAIKDLRDGEVRIVTPTNFYTIKQKTPREELILNDGEYVRFKEGNGIAPEETYVNLGFDDYYFAYKLQNIKDGSIEYDYGDNLRRVQMTGQLPTVPESPEAAYAPESPVAAYAPSPPLVPYGPQTPTPPVISANDQAEKVFESVLNEDEIEKTERKSKKLENEEGLSMLLVEKEKEEDTSDSTGSSGSSGSNNNSGGIKKVIATE